MLCIYIYTYIFIYIHTHTHTHTRTQTHMYTDTQTITTTKLEAADTYVLYACTCTEHVHPGLISIIFSISTEPTQL